MQHTQDLVHKTYCLNEFFKSVFTIDNGLTCDSTYIKLLNASAVTKIVIVPKGVLKLLESLDTNKSSGPDEIKRQHLKTFSIVLYTSLSEIFDYSLLTSTLLSIWKTARVQPVFKKNE